MVRSTPRVLIVAAQALRRSSGFGVTMANLLQDYPVGYLRQIYMDVIEPDSQMCGGVWRLGIENVPGDRFVRPLLNRLGLVVGRAGASIPSSAPSDSVPVSGTMLRLRSLLRAHADLVPLRIDPNLERWVHEFKPDVILTILGNIRMSRLAVSLSERMDCPMLIYFLDDWPLTHYADTCMNWIPKRKLRCVVRKAVERSPLLLCISEDMAVEYCSRYKRRCEAFVNCAELGDYVPAVARNVGVIRFAYVGGLHLERWRNLVDLGVVLRNMSVADGNTRIELVVHAPASDISRFGNNLVEAGIVLGKSLSAEEVPGVLLEADVLVHVESFLPEVIGFCRLSLSTKIPQYLAAGRPILGYGPALLTSNRYIEKHYAGLVVGMQDHDCLMDAISRLRDDGKLRLRMGMNAWNAAHSYHDAGRQRKRFRKIITEVACALKPGIILARQGTELEK